jgi:hypothetical protein
VKAQYAQWRDCVTAYSTTPARAPILFSPRYAQTRQVGKAKEAHIRSLRVDLQDRAHGEHVAAITEYFVALTTLLDDLTDDTEVRAEDLTRAQAAKLRVDNARALLQLIRGASPKPWPS